MYDIETMIWREKERSRTKAVHMDSLRALIGIRRMDKVLNAQIRKLCRVKKGLMKGFLWWFGHVEGVENGRVAKRVFVEECVGSHSFGRPWKRWIDTVKDCLKKRGLNVSQGRRIVRVCEGK